MTLYRMCYLREGKPAGQTFAAASLDLAVRVLDAFEESTGIKVLTLKRLGRSRFTPTGRMREYHRVMNRIKPVDSWPWPSSSKMFITLITKEKSQ